MVDTALALDQPLPLPCGRSDGPRETACKTRPTSRELAAHHRLRSRARQRQRGNVCLPRQWNERVVAVKRMLPQFFGLAAQEVKLAAGERSASQRDPATLTTKRRKLPLHCCRALPGQLWDLFRDGRPGEEQTERQQQLMTDINVDGPGRCISSLWEFSISTVCASSIATSSRRHSHCVPTAQPEPWPRLVISDFGLCQDAAGRRQHSDWDDGNAARWAGRRPS